MTFLADPPDPKKDDNIVATAEDEGDEEDKQFDQVPVRVVCPHCGLPVITFIEHESSWLTYTAAVALLMTLGWAALVVVPVVYPLFKDVVHHCPKCLSVLATRSRVALPSWRHEVMSFRFGSCVVVLARKYVLLLTGVTLVIGGIHWVRTSGAPSSAIALAQHEAPLPLTWQNFTKDCGFKSYLGNPIHVNLAFDKTYRNHTFKWTGTALRHEDGFSFFGIIVRATLFVRMDPPQFPAKPDMSDIVLTFSDEGKLGQTAAKVKRGQSVRFEATMLEVGKRGAPHAMVLWDLEAPAVADAEGDRDASSSAVEP